MKQQFVEYSLELSFDRLKLEGHLEDRTARRGPVYEGLCCGTFHFKSVLRDRFCPFLTTKELTVEKLAHFLQVAIRFHPRHLKSKTTYG